MRADLIGAHLDNTNLSESNLYGANLHGAFLRGADLASVNFEPEPEKLPYLRGVAAAKNLSHVIFTGLPDALEELRRAFKQGRYEQQAREITYAIHRSKRILSLAENNPLDKVEGVFNLIAFEITCQYGMTPGRTLRTLLYLIILFSIPYAIPEDKVRTEYGRCG